MKWADLFAPATYSGSPYGTGNISDGEVAPEDIVFHEVRRHLVADSALAAIFSPLDADGDPVGDGSRIEVVDFRTPVDLRDTPRLQIYGGDTGESSFPYRSQDYECRVEIAARWDPSALVPIPPGYGSVWSMWNRVKRVLKANQHLVSVVSGVQQQLANRSEQSGAVSLPFVEDVGGDGSRPVCAQTLSWNFQLKVDFDTGRLINILHG